MEYRQNQLDQILFLIKRGFSYRDILTMPTYLRRHFVKYIISQENSN